MARDPIADLASAIGRLSVEPIAERAAKGIAERIDDAFASGAAPQRSGKLRRSIVVDGASDGILIRSQLPYAEAHQDQILPSKSEIQGEVRESFKSALGGLPRW